MSHNYNQLFPWGNVATKDAAFPLPSERVTALLDSHHLVGNFFHYRQALTILGRSYTEVFKEGSLNLDQSQWADFGPLNFFLGPPRGMLSKLQRTITADTIMEYPPDLITPLRAKVATTLFKRRRDSSFEVLGTEGAHAAMMYVLLTYVHQGDEVIITDPGYFFLEPLLVLAGAKIKKIALTRDNKFRLSVEDVKQVISRKTKAIIVCDPINPFGTVQTKKELLGIMKLAKKHNVLIVNNITHAFHSISEKKRHYPMCSLSGHGYENIITISGMSHSYGMAGVRLGYIGGAPQLLRPVLLMKSALTRINVSAHAQYASLYALEEKGYLEECDVVLKKNFERLAKIVEGNSKLSFVIKPHYGFFAAIDTSRIKASCQELTVALMKRKCAVYPADGLGDNGAVSYIRVNYSTPRVKHFAVLEAALPEAIAEAESRIYQKPVVDFFKAVHTDRAHRIIKLINAI